LIFISGKLKDIPIAYLLMRKVNVFPPVKNPGPASGFYEPEARGLTAHREDVDFYFELNFSWQRFLQQHPGHPGLY